MDRSGRRLSLVRGSAGDPAPDNPAAEVEALRDLADPDHLAPPMRAVVEFALRVAPSSLPVLILGETGVGKEVLARLIHHRSRQAEGPFLGLNCGGISESLADSELFGHERGAFTGAATAKAGLLETASGGTVLLDEVGEMPPSIQAKLLRALDAREVLPVGAVRPRPIEVRVLAATNRDLEERVRAGTFRRDLLFRLNAVEIKIPPLRERRLEIPRLALRLLEAASRRTGRVAPSLPPRVIDHLAARAWPGNVRELRQAIELALVLCDGPEIRIEHLPAPAGRSTDQAAPPRLTEEQEAERRRMLAALEANAWNQSAAARALGMPRRTFVSKVAAYRLPRPRADRG